MKKHLVDKPLNLEPFMSQLTIDKHYDKHHIGYLSKLQSLVERH